MPVEMHKERTAFLIVVTRVSCIAGVFVFILATGRYLPSIPVALATDYSSASFRIMDPVLMPAGYSTSSSYSLTSTVAQIAIGTSTSGLWEDRSGFEYFPFVNTPILSAGAGDTTVSLSWTASIGVLGWTVSGYDVAQSTTSGGPYTYTNVGNVLATTAAGLTNGTPYYFVVRARDAFGNPIASSTESTATPVGATPPPPPPSPGGGGGGGGYTPPSQGTLSVSGRAYVEGVVTLLVDGTIARELDLSGADWATNLTLSAGGHQLVAYATDEFGRRSSLFGTVVNILSSGTRTVSDIFLSPTLEVDKEEVVRGDPVALSGVAYPSSEVIVMFGPDPLLIDGVRATRVPAATDGRYTYRLPTDDLTEGRYWVRTRASAFGETSALSRPSSFRVGKVSKPMELACMPGDLNADLRVNLTDFSIAVYWYKRPFTPSFADKEKRCLNNDGKIDLYDFSLMAYYWTG